MNDVLPCNFRSSPVLEGAEYDKIVKEFCAKSRFYHQLDLNKILLSEVVSNFHFDLVNAERETFGSRLFRRIRFSTWEVYSTGISFIKGTLSSIVYCWQLHMIQEGNNDIWYVTAENLRHAYASEMGVNTTTKSLLTHSLEKVSV